MSVHYLHRMDRDLETIRNADDAKTRLEHEMPEAEYKPDASSGDMIAGICVLAGMVFAAAAAIAGWLLA
jgi:hypothetical protein